MAEKLKIFTEHDIKVLKDVLETVRKRSVNATGKTLESNQPVAAPQKYVAFVPAGGIAARTTMTVHSAVCAIYQKTGDGDTATLVSAGFSRRVFNLSADAVTGNAFATAAQDNYGTWWHDGNQIDGGPGPDPDGPGTGTGTDGGWPGTGTSVSSECPLSAEELLEIAGDGLGVDTTGDCPKLRVVTTPVVCPTISFEEVEIICEDAPDTGTGPSSGNLNLYRRKVYLSIQNGCIVQEYGAWLFQNTIACCDPTCYSGGVGTGTGEGVTGTGGAGGGGGTPVFIPCCENTVPSILRATISDTACWTNPITLTYDAVGPIEWGDGFIPGWYSPILACHPGDEDCILCIYCHADLGWRCRLGRFAAEDFEWLATEVVAQGGGVCDPFVQSFIQDDATDCGLTSPFTVMVTE